MSQNSEALPLDVQYGRPASLYASQFLINAKAEELTLDCSSGVEQTAGATVVPVHTRLALSWEAAQRLHSLLSQALQQRAGESNVPAAHFRRDDAQLPAFEG